MCGSRIDASRRDATIARTVKEEGCCPRGTINHSAFFSLSSVPFPSPMEIVSSLETWSFRRHFYFSRFERIEFFHKEATLDRLFPRITIRKIIDYLSWDFILSRRIPISKGRNCVNVVLRGRKKRKWIMVEMKFSKCIPFNAISD